jgi:glyoxylase-like metal-dependent hydrolase (beta-lactamase superfamily II)
MLLTSQENGLQVFQLLAGRDFCKRSEDGTPRTGNDQIAAQMSNFVYCVFDSNEKRAMLVDPCWDIEGIFDTLSSLGINNIETCAYTHHHFDHTGGYLPTGYTGGRNVVVPGIAEAAAKDTVQDICAGKLDVAKIAAQCKISVNTIRPLSDGDRVWETDNILIGAWHTPGHTAGSTCFLAFAKNQNPNDNNKKTPPVMITGDTLFIGSCGRYDLPDSNVNDMVMSLERLSTLPIDTVVCPGHNYAVPTQTTIGQEQLTNQMMQQSMKFASQLRQKINNGTGGTSSSVKKNSVKKNQTSAIVTHIPLPDYLGVARHVLESHVQWNTVHSELRCEECCTIYEPAGPSL